MKALPIVLATFAIGTAFPAWWPRAAPESSAIEREGEVFGKTAGPEAVASLRVVTWNEQDKEPKVFEVKKQNGTWGMSSSKGGWIVWSITTITSGQR